MTLRTIARDLLAAEWTKVLGERHWHRPYLRD
jgi:hypothetical protein